MSQIENLRAVIRQLSLSRLSLTAPIPGLTLKETQTAEDLVHGAMMSVILIAGGAFRLAFKAHFTSRSVKNLLVLSTGAPSPSIQETQIKDYMREYCNLVAGGVKASFTSIGVASGISLPLVTDGFDEVLYVASQKPDVVQDLWEVNWSSGAILCGTSLEILDRDQFNKLAIRAEASSTETSSDEDAFL